MEIFSAYSAADRVGLLRQLSEVLYQRGFVKETYQESILTREKNHPTGLMVEDLINIAIPHTDVEHVQKPSMVVVKSKGAPFQFFRMDDPAQEIPVEVVFLLVVKEPDGYVSFLASLTNLFQDPGFITLLKNKNPEEICHELIGRLEDYQLAYQGMLISEESPPQG